MMRHEPPVMDAFIENIRMAIHAGVLTVRIVVDELHAQGYHTTADVPPEKRKAFFDRVCKLYERSIGL